MTDSQAVGSRFPLLPEDLLSVDWKPALGRLTSNNELEIRDQTRALLKGAQAASDESAIRLWGALDGLMSMSLNNDDAVSPLHPTFVSAEGRTPALEDFPHSTLELLSKLLSEVKSGLIVARISDALWITKREHIRGRDAVSAYLQSAEIDIASDRVMYAVPQFVRAAIISAELGKTGDLHRKTMEKIARWIPVDCTSRYNSYLARTILDLFHDLKWGNDPLLWADIANGFAECESRIGRLDVARQLWESEIQFAERASATERIKSTREKIALSYEEQAKVGTHMQRAHWLTQAIGMWRRIGGKQDRIQALVTRLKAEQIASKSEMSEVATTFDATEIHAAALKAIEGRTEIDAIIALGLMHSPKIKSDAVSEIRQDVADFPMTMIIGASFNTVEGNVSAVIPSLKLDSDLLSGENREWLDGHLSLRYSQEQTLVGQTFIESARRELNRSNSISAEAWKALTSDNPFVPPGREEFFGRGLEAGLSGDFPTCAHFLIPQLENSIRHTVALAGGVVTAPAPDNPGIQRELDLNQLLRDPRYTPKTIEVLGEETVLDLRALLVDGAGHNLRNRLSHGLIDYPAFYSPAISYLWWITIQLCGRSYLVNHRDKIPRENLPPDPPQSATPSP